MIYIFSISDFLYISDLNVINNSCPSCEYGMIRINDIKTNTPVFNNIILRSLKFENNLCGSGCLVITKNYDINLYRRRLL